MLAFCDGLDSLIADKEQREYFMPCRLRSIITYLLLHKETVYLGHGEIICKQ